MADYQTWLEENRERVDLWCSTEGEQREMYEAERALAAEGRTVEEVVSSIPPERLPTAFRLTAEAKGRFQRHGYYEHLIKLRATNRKAFDSLSPAVKFSLAHYEQAKLKHEEVKSDERTSNHYRPEMARGSEGETGGG